MEGLVVMGGALLMLLCVILPLGWLVIWCGVTWLIGLSAGWGRLARRFRDTGLEPVAYEGVRVMWVGWSRYRRTASVGISAGGLHLRVPWMFRCGHPPLFIPWGDLHEVQPGGTLPAGMVRCTVGTPAITTLTLPESIFESEAAQRFYANPIV
jgi:hypothetical protein